MEYRRLGGSGFSVPALSFGTGTFGGKGELFAAWGATDVKEATRLVDICLEAGLNMFDSADIYSDGAAEEILGEAIKGRRNAALISTKGTFRSGEGPNDVGSSRFHLINAVEGSLKRLATDYIDLYQLHGFDAATPVEETLSTLDDLVRAGKIRYIGCSNFSGWHLMKSLAVVGALRPAALCRQSGLLFAGRARLRMGADAARPRPACRRRGVEPARLGPAHRQDPARPALARDEPAAQDRRDRAADRRRASLSRRRRARRDRGRDRQDRSADRAQLAVAAPDRGERHHRRARRGAAAAKPRRRRLGADAGAGRQARRGERTPGAYPYWHQRAVFSERNPPPV